MSTLSEIWVLPINLTIWRHNDARLRHCVNQVMPEVGNDEYIIVHNFSIGGLRGPPVTGSNKSPFWIGLRWDSGTRYITLLHDMCLWKVYETNRSFPIKPTNCDCLKTVDFVRYNSSGRFSETIVYKKRSIRGNRLLLVTWSFLRATYYL